MITVQPVQSVPTVPFTRAVALAVRLSTGPRRKTVGNGQQRNKLKKKSDHKNLTKNCNHLQFNLGNPFKNYSEQKNELDRKSLLKWIGSKPKSPSIVYWKCLKIWIAQKKVHRKIEIAFNFIKRNLFKFIRNRKKINAEIRAQK